jgi:N-acetylglucosamine kinase-like BadF-type ATPase
MGMTAGRTAGTVLAIDGGNSKTDVVIARPDGEVLAAARGGGLVPEPERIVRVLDDLVAQAARAAGLTPGAGDDPDRTASPVGVVDHVAAYLAHCDLPYEQRALHAAISARGWGASVTVDNDTFAVLRSGSTRPYGVGLVCGAGINCVAVGRDGRTARYPALGRRSGDWGGGNILGEEILWSAVRAEDGRGPRTALLDAVSGHFARARATDVSIALHTGEIAEERLAELTHVLFAAADDGDEVAGGLVDRMGREIAVMARAAMRGLDFGPDPVEVVLGGGLVAGRHPRLFARIHEGFAEGGPVELRVVTAPPVLGAALLGLERDGAVSAPVAERLGRAITHLLTS